MPTDTYDEILRLRTALRDLVALCTIPAAWVGTEPPAVAAGLAETLIGLMPLDFAFVRLCDPGGAGAVDVSRGNAWTTFPEWLKHRLATRGRVARKEIIPNVDGDAKPCRGIVVPIGINGEGGVVAVASVRAEFPTDNEQLLLSLAANQAATAFQSARLIAERTRAERELEKARTELEVKVAERTAELRRSEAYLSEGQRLTRTGSFALSVATGEPTHASDELSRLFGFDPRQGVPSLEQVLQRIHPEDRTRCTEVLARGIREAASFELEYRIVPPQSPLRYIRATAHPVLAPSGELEEFVGTVVDVTESKRAEKERQAQLWFFESLDGINRAIQSGGELEPMMGEVLDVVLTVFACDRAWLVDRSHREAGSHRVRIERTRPGYTGVVGLGEEIPNDPEVAEVLRSLLASGGPVRFDPQSGRELPSALAERFSIQSMLATAVYPKVHPPYVFGLHQCSYPRIWTPQDERLFQEIGRRLADALDTLLMFRDLRDSERKLEHSRAELAASRARIAAAADAERRRVVRDLHDGAQQRLVHTIITLQLARRSLQNHEETASALVSEALEQAERANIELRELAHGILPSDLTHGGLRAGVQQLASRMPLPVTNSVSVARLPAAVEATAYFVVAEALTNVAKHARARHAEVIARVEHGTLAIQIRDDGIGGAQPDGTGLVGLADRLAALDGRLRVESPANGGTLIAAAIPIAE
jgi:signal transduction histidine kinase